MVSSALVVLFVAHIIVQPTAAANANFAQPARPLVAASWVHTRDVRRSLSDVMDDNLSSEHRKAKEVRVVLLEETLRPLYSALPKNGHGRLEHSAVRYALHRHFVHKHAMYVKGLDPAGEAWDSSSPVDILEDKVPGYVLHLFEEKLHDGFDLKDLALLAATLEHFVHLENMERLEAAYRFSNVSVNESVEPEKLPELLDRYMFLQLHGGNLDTSNISAFDARFQNASKIIPEWPETQKFMREVQENILSVATTVDKSITFAIVEKVVEASSQRYGRFQDGECRTLTKDLIALEDKAWRGRVTLLNFYKAGRKFRESEAYLRSLGALEETEDIPRVIIPNYVQSKANCIATSSMYSVCCINQCEDLLAELERRTSAPETTPETLVHLIAILPSATVKAPRRLSVSLVKHLNDIAAGHDGKVPLHGRLFAQWMHHAYPRECPFPTEAGTTKPMIAAEWMKETNTSIMASATEIAHWLRAHKDFKEQIEVKELADGDLEATLPWSEAEELVFHLKKHSLSHELGVIGKAIACIGAVSALTFQLVKMALGAAHKVQGTPSKM